MGEPDEAPPSETPMTAFWPVPLVRLPGLAALTLGGDESGAPPADFLVPLLVLLGTTWPPPPDSVAAGLTQTRFPLPRGATGRGVASPPSSSAKTTSET